MSWFWFPEAIFGAARGVVRTKVGYAGGSKLTPNYRNMGDHTETVEVQYDPQTTNFKQLLDIFWNNHDPTSKCSRQYMSAIFFHDEDQRELAEKSKLIFNTNAPVTTRILQADKFYDAEMYHQKYLLQRHSALCHWLDLDPDGSELLDSRVLSRINGYLGGYGTMASFEEDWPTWGIEDKCVSYIRNQIGKEKGGGGCKSS